MNKVAPEAWVVRPRGARLYARLFEVPFLIFAVALNVIHPFIHAFEGGTLDMVIDYLTAAAAQIAANR